MSEPTADQLEARIAALEATIVEQRELIDALVRSSPALPAERSEQDVDPNPRIGRRALFARAAGAAVAGVGVAVGAGTWGASPAAAQQVALDDGNGPVIQGTNTANTGSPTLDRVGVKGVAQANGAYGVMGQLGVLALPTPTAQTVGGVVGSSSSGNGVVGWSTEAAGVLGVRGGTTLPSGFGNDVPAGVVASSNVGPALRASTPNSSSAIIGVAGDPVPDELVEGSLAAVYGKSRGTPGVAGFSQFSTGVVGVSNNDQGVVASSVNGSGLQASSQEGHGIVANGGIAPLLLQPRGVSGPPFGSGHLKGALVVDSAGQLYVCTASGSPGTWRPVQYQGTGSGSTTLLATPFRLFDTRTAQSPAPPLPVSKVKVNAGQTLTVQVTGTGGAVPAGAVGVTGSIAVTAPEAAGFLQLFPANLGSSSTSVLNFASGQTVANAFTAALPTSGGSGVLGALKLKSVGAKTHVIIDVTGYLL